MANNKKDQLIFIDGKELALRSLFTETFGYLAIGYSETNDGFQNPTTDTGDNGFHELSQTSDDPTYMRIPLVPYGEPVKDIDNGKVLYKFTADLDIDNIQRNILINQFAVVNSKTVGDVHTKIYAASTFTEFRKDDTIAITFVIGFRL